MSRRRVIDLISATVARARVASSTSRASGASRPRALDGFRNVAPREPSTSARAVPRAPSARGFAAEASEAAATPHPDGMPRFPEPSVAGALRLADYVGTSSFAMTGSLLAASSGMDAFGCAAVGTITAVGGGTVRDILLGRGRRAFWMEEQEYLWIATGTALATFFGWEEAKKRFGFADDDYWIEAGDALGVGAFCVIGAQNGIRAGVPMIAQMLCGVMTATFGGIAARYFGAATDENFPLVRRHLRHDRGDRGVGVHHGAGDWIASGRAHHLGGERGRRFTRRRGYVRYSTPRVQLGAFETIRAGQGRQASRVSALHSHYMK